MSFDIAKFRSDFPEFDASNPQVYSDSQITFWAGVGESLLNERRWGDLLPYGLELFVAHHISLAKAEQEASTLGQVAGQGAGLVSGEGAGGVSFNLDTQATLKSNAGNYNLTTYGREFYALVTIIGIGGAQL